ncbi:hypothetical protein JTB14_031235 [Gonioctena quinquepunctata]|nr:hypothetical protein JTB14_031235 [Gonioctena quinquepunctata]
MTSDEAFALLDEETLDQEGNVHSAPVHSTSSSRPKTLRKIITPRRIRHHQSSTVDLEEPELHSSDDSLEDPDYSVDKQNKNKKPSHRPAFVFSSESSEVSEEEVIEAEVAPPKVNACNEPGAIKWEKTSPLPNLSFKSFIFDRPFGLLCSISTDDVLSIFQTSFDGNIMETILKQSNLYALQKAVVNSYIMYKTQYKSENHASKCMTHLQFRSFLIDQLIGTFSSTQKRGRPIDEEGTGRKNNSRYARGTVHNSIRLLDVGSHLPVISTYRRCAFCSTKQKQKRSNLVCKACNVDFIMTLNALWYNNLPPYKTGSDDFFRF